MVQDLSSEAIETFLNEEIVARIAYVDRRGRPFIVPIAYAYDGNAFYGYSLLGAKIEGMRANPAVCIEIDRIVDAADWWSVVAHGIFEPLSGDAALAAIWRISNRMRAAASAGSAPIAAAYPYVTREGALGIAYRIRITGMSGCHSAATF
jgi:nitroimidazol reductase NimA-like FMN-containing flavoprotein (pyridoxamine 5'-phosphate oxidase superfamily)